MTHPARDVKFLTCGTFNISTRLRDPHSRSRAEGVNAMASVKILFFVTIILIILAAVALVALAQAGDIHEAVKAGDLDTVRRMIEQVSPNSS